MALTQAVLRTNILHNTHCQVLTCADSLSITNIGHFSNSPHELDGYALRERGIL